MADLYVILGVAHMSPPSPFVLTNKSYATPLGPAETDAELAASLRNGLDWDPFEFEILHRKEHSIEFQALFLRYCALQRGENFKALPVLVSSATEEREVFLKNLAEHLRAYPGKVCLVAGVDLSHRGRRFGDDFDMTPERLSEMEKEDRASLEYVLRMDPKGWYDSVAPGGKDERNVCGLGALYAFCWLLRDLFSHIQGKLLRYAHAPDPSGGEVSFASMSFLR
jgi:AmmeMemoRadiSam system protein B